MVFDDTGLPWVPSSPHIPDAVTAQYNLATGIIGELLVVNIGVGYPMPFRLFAAEWINADSLSDAMNALKLNGLQFRPVHYKPYYNVLEGKSLNGIQIYCTDPIKAPLGLLPFYLLQETRRLWPGKDIFSMADKTRIDSFDKVCGTDLLRKTFTKSWTVNSVKSIWESEIPSYREKVKKYFLY